MSDPFSPTSLSDKVAIVTGAARGVGEAIARRFVACGAHVVLGDVRDELGTSLAVELGERACFVSHDVTDERQWQGIVEHACSHFGRVDVLVNNAAVLHIGTLENTSAETARRVLEVNTLGPFLGLRAVVPGMKEQGAGAVVNVSSIDGMIGMNGVTAYAASKWGVRGLAKAAALEVGRSGIRVNTVCPAGGNAEMFAPWFEKMAPFMDETIAYSNDRAIPGIVPVSAIADAVVFLASDASKHLTGIDLPVDGGTVAGHFIPGFNTL